MTDKSVGQQIAEAVIRHNCFKRQICQPWECLRCADTIKMLDAILSIKRNDTTLRRVVELWEQGKLVQLDDDQEGPTISPLGSWSMLFQDGYDLGAKETKEAGFKRVTEIRGE